MGLIIEKQKTKDEVIRPKQKDEKTRRKVREGGAGGLRRGGGGGGGLGPSQMHHHHNGGGGGGGGGGGKSSGSGSSGEESRGRRRWKPIQVVTMAAIRENSKARSRSAKRHKDKSSITGKGGEKARRTRGNNDTGARDGRSLRRGEVQGGVKSQGSGSGTIAGGKQRQGASSHSSGRLEHSSSFNRNHINNKSFRASSNSSTRRSTRGVRSSSSGTPSGASRRPPRPNSLTATFQTLVPLAALSPSPSGPDIATCVALIACGGVGRSGEGAGGAGSGEGDSNIIASCSVSGDGGGGKVIKTEETQKTEACDTSVGDDDAHDTKPDLNDGDNQPNDITSVSANEVNAPEEENEIKLQNEEDPTPADSTYDAEDIENDILNIIATLNGDGGAQRESSTEHQNEKDSLLTNSTYDEENNENYITGISSIPTDTKSTQDEEKEDNDSTPTNSIYDNVDSENHIGDITSIPTDARNTPEEEKEKEEEIETQPRNEKVFTTVLHRTSFIEDPDENEETQCVLDQSHRESWPRRVSLKVYITEESYAVEAEEEDERPLKEKDERARGETSCVVEDDAEQRVYIRMEDETDGRKRGESKDGEMERGERAEKEIRRRVQEEIKAREKEEEETEKEESIRMKEAKEKDIKEAKEEIEKREKEGKRNQETENEMQKEDDDETKRKRREENRNRRTVNDEEANVTESEKKMKEGTRMSLNEGLEVVSIARTTERDEEETKEDNSAGPNEEIGGKMGCEGTNVRREGMEERMTMKIETSGANEKKTENAAKDRGKGLAKREVTEKYEDEERMLTRGSKVNEEEDSEIKKIKAIADGLREIRDLEETIIESEEAKEKEEEEEEEEDKQKDKEESNVMSKEERDNSSGVSEAGRLYYRQQLLKAIQSLDTLNDQIVEFVFSGVDFDDERHGGSPKQREALKSSMALMRRLLVDAQSKFRKMVEDNKQLASRIDGDLQTAHQEVSLLRQELADTNRRITELTGLTPQDAQQQQQQEGGADSPDNATTPVNGSNHSELTSNQLVEEVSQLRLENEKLSARNRSLQSEVEELRRVKENIVEEDLTLKPKISEMTVELTHAKEALSALKADRKRLKAEKFDLLNQMKQLYATLEDKEKELRDFIRNYEQRMKDSDESLRHLAAERDETEREKWNILKHARDESEKVVKLSAQLGLKEATVKKLQEELDMVRKQLNSVGYYSDAESVRTNGLPTPTASTPTCSPLPVATPTPTPNGRGSSADSGVRLSSDRESTASHDGAPFLPLDRGSVDCDSYRCAAVPQYLYYACGPGTPKESPSLSPLYATPAYCRAGDDQSGRGDKTPTSVQTPVPMSGLANSSASAGGLSRSAEQLCERLSEAGEISKAQGSSTLMRKNHKSGSTWGSISRVFARQKKRAALDTSIYNGSGSDKRASWSPSSSLCASPLTEESYSEKLRLLEEAQHIPLERWKAPTVLAWLEVTLGMAQYGAMCAENVRSGKVLLELSDSELEAGLGITHPMHRKKLRLAIEELREPRLSRYPRISALGHTWVSSEWLPDLGLPQYSENFANSLVDGRLLEALTKKELEKHLGVHRKFHQASIIHGVHLLRIVRFDRQVLAERRRQCELVDADPVVWTNLRWVRWARSIDLAEYADNLKDSGVHGALVVLEPSFTADTMATALGIPQSKNIIRRHLATELESLVNPARQQLDEQARYAKMERRRQEKLASGGSLGRSFSRSYGTGLEKGDKDKRRASLRGSLSRALGLRLREEAASVGSTNGGGESSSSGGQSPAVTTRAHPRHGPHARPRSSIMPSQAYFHHETHRRVKSIGDIETITVTPV